jgi:cytochrome bd-type quinol oxidase subunit 2
MSQKKQSLQDVVMQRISSGEVDMKPRAYFALLGVATVAASLLAGILLAYVTSIFTYIIRIQTADTPAYGAKANLAAALAEFPWWLLLVALASVFFAVWFARRNSRLYRRSFVSVAVAFVVISAIVGIGFSYAGIGHSSQEGDSPASTSETLRGRGLHRSQ